MRDDIPTRLRDAAADPSHTPDFDVLAAHGRRQHLAGRTTTALVAVVALIAGGVALWPSSGPANRMPAIGDAPATASSQTPAGPALPSGWHEIRVGDAVLGVPGDWDIQELREPTTVCPNMADHPTAYVHLAALADGRICHTRAAHHLTVEVAPLSGVPDLVLEPADGRSWETVTTSTGLAGQRLTRGENGLVVAYRFPELDLWLQFAGGEPIDTQPGPILETLTRAPVPAAPAGRGDLPTGWQPVEAGDASFGVPGDWDTARVDVMATSCPNVLSTPTVLVLDLDQPNTEPAGCDPSAGTVPTLTTGSLSTWHDLPNVRRAERDGEPVIVNGHGGERFGDTDEGETDSVIYEFEELDLLLWFRRVDLAPDLPEEVLDTLATSHGGAPEPPRPPTPGEATGASLTLPRPVPDHSDVRTRSGAAGHQVICDGPLHLGGWVLDLGGPAIGAADPQGALQAFLDQDLFRLPADGYSRAATEPGRVLFTHEVEGAAKVAVIVADSAVVDEQIGVEDGWGFETFATCDPAEYGPGTDDELGQTIWTDRDGNRVPTSTITSYPGHSHCDWQSVTFLHLDDRQYLRDPEHLLTDQTVQPYEEDAELPDDAVDTGYRNDGRELWLAADSSVAYVVTDSTVEVWPSTTAPVGCA